MNVIKINEENIITSIKSVANNYILQNGEYEKTLSREDLGKIYNTETGLVEDLPSLPSYEIENLTVTTNGTAADWTLSGDHVAEIDDDIVISCDLIGGSAITYPGAIIKLPIVRHADGKPTDDEIYFNASIVDGTLTAPGKIPRSGDWKLLTSRINKALDRINAGWHLDADDLGFLV